MVPYFYSYILLVWSPWTVSNSFLLHSTASTKYKLFQQISTSTLQRLHSYSDRKNNIILPEESLSDEDILAGIERPPEGYHGEWEDWDTDSYIGDGTETMNMLESNKYSNSSVNKENDYDDDVRPDPFFLEGTTAGKAMYRDSWADWSEEPPYFDENYTDEEEEQHATDAIQAFRETQAATRAALIAKSFDPNTVVSDVQVNKDVHFPVTATVPSTDTLDTPVAVELRLLRNEVHKVVVMLGIITSLGCVYLLKSFVL